MKLSLFAKRVGFMSDLMSVHVLIVAAGSGARMGGVPKQYRRLAGRFVLDHTLACFDAAESLQCVIAPDHGDLYAQTNAASLCLPPVLGGQTRQDSVRLGLEALVARGARGLVLIHDAARPFVPPQVIAGVTQALHTHRAVAPALAVVDSLRRAIAADSPGPGLARVSDDVARDGLWRVQTPQGFHLEEIASAHQTAAPGHTDDISLARAAGFDVFLTPGDERNFKITTEADWQRAEHMIAPLMIPHVGNGFDVHRFGDNADGSSDHVWLCGVSIPHTHGLVGHSDADVGLHALCDALFGALAEGDIGSHFPPTDPQWRGAPSARFVAHAQQRVAARGGRIAHVDITLICERPKIGPHRAAMQARVAELLAVDGRRVSVKATTTEELGFTGRREGIAALASVTLLLPADM